ncbi:type IV toxin-antitoxin system AbiEi family antitoxin domain-containing protein [Nocardioides sp. CFH 31398]|uniref:type IV toxin-antitoxin system AbiEi family antitoxin domain-containing protein n=1 Tax=Nocardioides sp. CFH 31398 TaxID=2919579 RepID=UPI001F054AE8|nr:type IV toxin-antitoxin system AbiEi family antitoxin domain-containing protein [Nocardioides sp. CFH 31398]MCH1864971.1 type IV toxin-antitoxin system AbiEi family antitoxin domain-containing protein [Nocardioides sp. CFH 31398]
MTPLPPALRELVDLQDGVVARRQALAAGMTSTAVERLVRRREWVAVHPGVYVTHTGPLSWLQRAWAAVLACWPAVLDAHSALRAAEGPGRSELSEDVVRVAVERGRHVAAPDGVVVRRVARLDDLALWRRHPPVLRYEAAVLHVADRAATEMAAVGWLAEACGGRRTTAHRLRQAMSASPRMHRRLLIDQILDDVEAGTCSVLERAYRRRVERAHGLPRGVLQAPARDRAGRPMLRDVLYPRHGLVVELDGRASSTRRPGRATVTSSGTWTPPSTGCAPSGSATGRSCRARARRR